MSETITTKPYHTKFAHLADLKDWVGKELGLSEWTTIDQKKIDTFAEATEDYQWIHIDPERSKKESPYKKTIAHGFLILSYASKFTYDTFSVGDMVMGVNYGLGKVRFPNATPSDAEIRGRVSLLDYKEIMPDGKGARYTMKVVFEIKGEAKPACVAEFLAQAYADPTKQNDEPFAAKLK